MSRWLPAALAAALSACASRPPCDASQAATVAFDRDLPDAALGTALPGCAPEPAAVAAALAALVAERCSGAAGWAAGRAGAPPPPACERRGGEEWSAALDLGGEHARLGRRLARVEERLAGGDAERGKLSLERVALIRDLEQLEGVAVLRGWVPDRSPAGPRQGRQKQ